MSNQVESLEYWRKCSSCKKPMPYAKDYWVCNVSTCNRKRTGLIFCSVSCWDAHVPLMNHRESWAEERRAPTLEAWKKTVAGEDEKPARKKAAIETTEKFSAPEAPAASKVILRRSSS